MFLKIITGLKKLYSEKYSCKRWPITCNILLRLISRFDQTTLEGANLHFAFCLIFIGFLQMGEFTYNKVESEFSSWNLTKDSVFLSENRLFLIIPSCKTDPSGKRTIYIYNSLKQITILYSLNMLRLLATIMLQRNFKQEFVLWDTKKIIQVICLEEN